MAFKAMYGNAPTADLKADYQAAVKFGVFRIGKEALYFPAFPTGAKYVPLTALDGAWVQKSAMSPKGCCGGQIPVFVLHVRYNTDQLQLPQCAHSGYLQVQGCRVHSNQYSSFLYTGAF